VYCTVWSKLSSARAPAGARTTNNPKQIAVRMTAKVACPADKLWYQ
jgi:hypothetical protein